ncbi:MAG: recombinase family protein [Verrucomicrobiaceae bacterium]|nr:recombinase family protein [Verrucomicrobiaceae bacterium]
MAHSARIAAMEKRSLPVAILVRVSTNRQETDRQVSELTAYAAKKGYEVVEVCKETVSGKSDESDREGLQRALFLAQSGAVKKVLVHEVSRLARRSSIAHRFVEALEEAHASLYWHQQGIETLLENGKRNPAAAIMFALLAEMARSERETLIDRINSGLAEARRKGKTLGRPKGTSMQPKDRVAKHRDILRLLNAGTYSLRQIASITGKSKLTVQRVKAARNEKPLAY